MTEEIEGQSQELADAQRQNKLRQKVYKQTILQTFIVHACMCEVE